MRLKWPWIEARGVFPFLAVMAWSGAARAAAPLPAPLFSHNLTARVILLANSSDPDSGEIARHYSRIRSVPVENIVSLPMSIQETISWPEFVATIWQPLQDELVRRGWINAKETGPADCLGRKKYSVFGHSISALVVCRGVPLRIRDDRALNTPVPPFTDHEEFRTNQGAVDSELSLLAADGGYPISAFVENPLYRRAVPTEFERGKVVEVGRLDGPTAADARSLVDRAVAAERVGLAGRAYVDLGGPYPEGDRWLDTTAAEIGTLGFDATIDRDPATLPATSRFDAPVLYFGWYTRNISGPFTLPGFRFPQGAIAIHIHSFSARTLRSATEAWCGPLIARGVTATVGNVWEPFLEYTHHPDILLRGLARGDTLADAAYRSIPVLSWQSVLIGDPLYRPFAVPLLRQLDHLERLPEGLAGYAALRYVDLLDAAGRTDEASATLRLALAQEPNLALGVASVRRVKGPVSSEAIALLKTLLERDSLKPDEWVLAREAAELLSANGRPDLAVAEYRRLFEIKSLPAGIRAQWLVTAKAAAVAARDTEQALTWKQSLDETVAEILAQRN
jgi:uncharacterized protein (TIGR03790 family)